MQQKMIKMPSPHLTEGLRTRIVKWARREANSIELRQVFEKYIVPKIGQPQKRHNRKKDESSESR